MSQSQKYVLFHVNLNSILDIADLDQIQVLSRYLSSGSAQLLLHPDISTSNNSSPLSSYLSFEGPSNANNENQVTQNLSHESSHRFPENAKKVVNMSEFDEEQNEIRFSRKPEFYHQFSNNLQTILLTNDANSRDFATRVKIDFDYFEATTNTQSQNPPTRLSAASYLTNTSPQELIIIDYKCISTSSIDDKSNNVSAITSLFEELQAAPLNLLINVLISPFLDVNATESYLHENFRLTQMQDQQAASLLAEILPKQTWSTYQGIDNTEFLASKKSASLSVFFDAKGCRQDTIKQFENIQNKLAQFGFSHINSMFLFREITFKLGKLPKYGA